jgi:hypothetical protein
MLSNAERQKRYRDRAREALRNQKAAQGNLPLRNTIEATELVPLRVQEPEEEDAPAWTETEAAADDLMNRLIFKVRKERGSREHVLFTRHADTLIALIERDPAGLVDYIRRWRKSARWKQR